MKKISLTAERTQFSRLVEAASRGESIVITRYGRPVATLGPPDQPVRKGIIFGLMKGQIEIGPEFDDPLPDWLLDAFEGKSPD